MLDMLIVVVVIRYIIHNFKKKNNQLCVLLQAIERISEFPLIGRHFLIRRFLRQLVCTYYINASWM